MSNFSREFLIIAALTIFGATFSLLIGLAPLPWAQPKLAAGEITLVDARALQILWIDARSEEDYHTAHIPEAILLNEDNWENGVVDLMNAWLANPRTIVVYCGSESCGTSRQIATRLRETLPNAEIYSLKGGWDAWVK